MHHASGSQTSTVWPDNPRIVIASRADVLLPSESSTRSGLAAGADMAAISTQSRKPDRGGPELLLRIGGAFLNDPVGSGTLVRRISAGAFRRLVVRAPCWARAATDLTIPTRSSRWQ